MFLDGVNVDVIAAKGSPPNSCSKSYSEMSMLPYWPLVVATNSLIGSIAHAEPSNPVGPRIRKLRGGQRSIVHSCTTLIIIWQPQLALDLTVMVSYSRRSPPDACISILRRVKRRRCWRLHFVSTNWQDSPSAVPCIFEAIRYTAQFRKEGTSWPRKAFNSVCTAG